MARKTKKQAIETKEKIVAAAIEIFGERNFSNVSVVEIAEKIGMTKGAIYWHFKGKNDILLHIIEESCKNAELSFVGMFENPEDMDDITSFFKKNLRRPKQDPEFQKINRFVLRRHEWPSDLQQQVEVIVRDSHLREIDIVANFLRKCQEDGKIRKDVSARDVAILYTSVFHGLFVLQIAGILPDEVVDQIDFLAEGFKLALVYED